jgi:hypothetical protein
MEMPSGPRQPFWGEIKQVQILMVLLSCLPEQGKLREVFRLALEVPEDEALANVTPCPMVSTDGLRTWLTTIWSGELGERMRDLVEWQKNSENMKAAVQELMEVQDRLGFTLSIVRRE